MIACSILALILFLIGAMTCWTRGLPMAFAMIYIPTLLLLSNAARVDLPALPDISPPMAVGAGIVFGLILKGGETPLFRWTVLDTIVISLSFASVITGWVTNTFYTGVHIIGVQMLEFIIPYFIARWAFHSPPARRAALLSAITCISILAFFAPIEMRLWPYFYNRMMNSFAPRQATLRKALTRFGLFRASLGFLHPIDCGNSTFVITGLIGTLGASTIFGINNIFVLGGIAAAILCMGTSLSFGPIFAAAFAGCVWFCLNYIPFTRRLVVLGVFIVAAGLVGLTLSLLKVNVSISHSLDPLERSYQIRALIAQNSMPFVKNAGLFGYGEKINQTTLQLRSVDNSYILFAMTRGWLFTGMWIAIPFVLAWRVQRSFSVARSKLEIFALSASFATVLGTNVAMFTVWAGSTYAKIWLVMVAFTCSLTEWFLAPVVLPANQLPQIVYRPGFPMRPARMPPPGAPPRPAPAPAAS